MPRWVAFGALTLLVVAVLLLSSHASARVINDLTARQAGSADVAGVSGSDVSETPEGTDPIETVDAQTPDSPEVSKRAIFANVATSHGLFAAVLLAGIVLADVPLSSLGVGVDSLSGGKAIGLGFGSGLVIAVANLLVGAIADAFDADPSGPLRELLAPESRGGWLVLLFVVLPVVAGFEELLFRGALIGAFAIGFELSPWVLAVGSSVAFAAGHGAQGWLGIVGTGALGFVLAAVFISTGSLLVVAIAHYVVNTVEFVLLEGIGFEPADLLSN